MTNLWRILSSEGPFPSTLILLQTLIAPSFSLNTFLIPHAFLRFVKLSHTSKSSGLKCRLHTPCYFVGLVLVQLCRCLYLSLPISYRHFFFFWKRKHWNALFFHATEAVAAVNGAIHTHFLTWYTVTLSPFSQCIRRNGGRHIMETDVTASESKNSIGCFPSLTA